MAKTLTEQEERNAALLCAGCADNYRWNVGGGYPNKAAECAEFCMGKCGNGLWRARRLKKLEAALRTIVTDARTLKDAAEIAERALDGGA